MRIAGLALALFALIASAPAALRAQLTDAPAGGNSSSGGSIIGSRPGSLRPRVPVYNQPRWRNPGDGNLPMPSLPAHTPQTTRLPNTWTGLFYVDDVGPPSGMTLEAAADRLVQASVTLRAKALDIPQARADVLTAGLHANPVVYFDAQLVPYRPYNPTNNPAGPTQYDLNVAYPVDLSGKRHARVEVACAAGQVVEALYQEAARQEIDRLSTAYVDALAARQALRQVKAALASLVAAEDARRAKPPANELPPPEPDRQQPNLRKFKIQRHRLEIAVRDAEASWSHGKRVLGTLLNLPNEQVAQLELRGSLDDNAPTAPPLAELQSMARANRPDLAAYRLAIERATADVRLAKANRLPDVYLLYQPYTLQDQSPFGFRNSTSWAAGATVTVPIFDRNQGNIRRTQVNVEQARLELQVFEQRIQLEVESAYEEYLSSQRSIDQIEDDLLPDLEELRQKILSRQPGQQIDLGEYLHAQQDLDDLGRQYRDLLVRHRRAMLNINTVVGRRVLP
jgi:cobalt-zinc-cadmium efflux system outer membrane protein